MNNIKKVLFWILTRLTPYRYRYQKNDECKRIWEFLFLIDLKNSHSYYLIIAGLILIGLYLILIGLIIVGLFRAF